MVKNLSAMQVELGLIPGLWRSPGEGNGNPLQYTCLGNPMGRGAWRATVYGVGWQRVWHDWVTNIAQACLAGMCQGLFTLSVFVATLAVREALLTRFPAQSPFCCAAHSRWVLVMKTGFHLYDVARFNILMRREIYMKSKTWHFILRSSFLEGHVFSNYIKPWLYFCVYFICNLLLIIYNGTW